MLAWVGGSKRRLRKALSKKPRVNGVTDSAADHDRANDQRDSTAGGKAPRGIATGVQGTGDFANKERTTVLPVVMSSSMQNRRHLSKCRMQASMLR